MWCCLFSRFSAVCNFGFGTIRNERVDPRLTTAGNVSLLLRHEAIDASIFAETANDFIPEAVGASLVYLVITLKIKSALTVSLVWLFFVVREISLFANRNLSVNRDLSVLFQRWIT